MAEIEQVDETKKQKKQHNSYQNLMEGRVEVIVSTKDDEYGINVSELLRDLYKKLYTLEKQVALLKDPTLSS